MKNDKINYITLDDTEQNVILHGFTRLKDEFGVNLILDGAKIVLKQEKKGIQTLRICDNKRIVNNQSLFFYLKRHQNLVNTAFIYVLTSKSYYPTNVTIPKEKDL